MSSQPKQLPIAAKKAPGEAAKTTAAGGPSQVSGEAVGITKAPPHPTHTAELPVTERDPCAVARIILEHAHSMDQNLESAHHTFRTFMAQDCVVSGERGPTTPLPPPSSPLSTPHRRLHSVACTPSPPLLPLPSVASSPSPLPPPVPLLPPLPGAFPGQRDLLRDEYRAHFDRMRHSMPDINLVCYDMAESKSAKGAACVFTRFIQLGRFSGAPLYDLAPTHGKVEVRGTAFLRFNDEGRVAYMELFYSDALEVLAYLGCNLYKNLPARGIDTAVHGPQGLLGTRGNQTVGWEGPGGGLRVGAGGGAGGGAEEEGLGASVREALSAFEGRLPPTIHDAIERLRVAVTNAASEGQEGLHTIVDKLREFVPGLGGANTAAAAAAPAVSASAASSSAAAPKAAAAGK
jgi:hypothetical protein